MCYSEIGQKDVISVILKLDSVSAKEFVILKSDSKDFISVILKLDRKGFYMCYSEIGQRQREDLICASLDVQILI